MTIDQAPQALPPPQGNPLAWLALYCGVIGIIPPVCMLLCCILTAVILPKIPSLAGLWFTLAMIGEVGLILGVPLGVVAIILGAVGLRRSRNIPGGSGESAATAGLALGLLMPLAVLFAILLVNSRLCD